MARLAQPSARQASFTERKTLAALTGAVEAQGRLSYRKPDHLEKVTTAPAYESLVVDGDRLVINAGQDAPRVVPLGSQPALLALVDTIRGALSGDLALLQRSYTVTGSGTLAAWHVTLTPRDPALAQLVREIQLDGTQGELRRMQTVSPNGDTDTLDITPTPPGAG